MKHIFLTILFSLALLPLKAQKSETYGFVRLTYTEIADSLYRINKALENVQIELDKHKDEVMKIKGVYYYGERNTAIDSLMKQKSELESQKSMLLRYKEEKLGLDVHLANTSKYVRKAYTMDLVGTVFVVGSSVGLGCGYAKDKTALKVMGYITGSAALGCFIGAYTCHFKSGQKLRLAANSITYSF